MQHIEPNFQRWPIPMPQGTRYQVNVKSLAEVF